MSLMEESANAELQGRPGGAVGARGVPRGTGEGTSGRREVKRGTRQEGPAAPQPTSTSGLVKVSVAGPSRPSLLPSSPVTSSVFFSSCSRVQFSFSLSLSLSFSFSHPLGFLAPLRQDPYRIIASYHARIHALFCTVASAFFSFVFSFLHECNLRSCEIPISGDIRVIE